MDASASEHSGTATRDATLTEREHRMLGFEGRDWPNPAQKAEAIRSEFGLSAARYYRILGGLIDTPAALRHDPMLIARLQRMRERRIEARARRTLSNGHALPE